MAANTSLAATIAELYKKDTVRPSDGLMKWTPPRGYRGPRRFKTYPHRYGEGKVHMMTYDRAACLWVTVCRPEAPLPHGRLVEPATDVSCRNCIRVIQHG